MKRMLFIIPWSEFYIGNTDCNFTDEPERASEGVVGLATYLKAHGILVKIADMQRMLRCNKGDDNQTLNDLWSICQSFNPEVIGFSFFTARFQYASHIFKYITGRFQKKKLERPLMIAGGVHPTLLPENTLSYIPFDAVIIGEGEIPLLQLLSGVRMEKIKGVFFLGKLSIEKADVISNLDELPFPDWNLVDKEFYTQPSHQISNTDIHKVMPITFGRGCMYRCNFCAHNCFLYARCHSSEYFINKMKWVSHQCGVDTFIVQDSSIGNFRDIWSEVCIKLIKLGTPYKWWANLRVNQVDENFLRLLKQAGCIKLFFGFKSGSQHILDKMNKRITVEQCRQTALLCHKIGIPFYSSYIVNYFDETEEDLELTAQLILETKPTSLAINIFSPVPGSIDYDKNISIIEPYIKNIHDWTKLGMLNLPLLFGNMSQGRFGYWYNYLRNLKKYINAHETIIGK